MSYITQNLLRKRAEHNEGCLSTLEEVSLHQQELLKIDKLEEFCRAIKILLLQNNIIPRIENIGKLKQLEYLNLALNNISLIENVEGCESLKKLDLTCNFIDVDDIEQSSRNLALAPLIETLYMTGNPCLDWEPCKELIIALVPQLKVLDGTVITPTSRIQAFQKLDKLLADLDIEIARVQLERAKKRKELEDNPPPPRADGDDYEEYTKENRKNMYLEIAQERVDDDKRKNPKKYEPKKPPTTMYLKSGKVRQCNEGKYDFQLLEYDDPVYTLFKLKLSKFLDTSLIEVNVDPKFVSVRVKGKLTQLKLTEEVMTEGAIVQRS